MPLATSIPNVNCLWGEIVAGALVRNGVKFAVISPGSRSAPLVWGLTRQPDLSCISVLDERSAAFYALGLARASGRPVALVCTSGTAVANFLPAVIEASLSAVPLLILTADRPPELRDCHAGQAIDQVKIFGQFPRWQHEVALPENRPDLLRYLRQTMVHACARAQFPWAGPVHLNFPFREPLAPVPQPGFTAPALVDLKTILGDHDGLPEKFALTAASVSSAAREILRAHSGIIIAGPAQPADRALYIKQVTAWARRRGWPILADALSPLRHARELSGQIIGHYDTILRSGKHLANLAPDAIIHLGPLPTSKVLRTWLAQLHVPVLIAHEAPDNVDPLHRPAHIWRGSLTQLAARDSKSLRPDKALLFPAGKNSRSPPPPPWKSEFSLLDSLFEGKAAWTLSRKLPEGTPVFAASSMPVRDCEFFWEPGHGQHFYFNRGANGIDGTVATALGVAHATGKPTVLYTGDLALLHDQNALLAARELPPGASLTIVCINNDGGGIFEHLPISKFDPPFERFFATPQNKDKFQEIRRLSTTSTIPACAPGRTSGARPAPAPQIRPPPPRTPHPPQTRRRLPHRPLQENQRKIIIESCLHQENCSTPS